MISIDKNLLANKKDGKSSNVFLYASLLIALSAAVVGGAVWYHWKKEEPDYDYQEVLGKHLTAPTADEVSKLISDNRSRLKSAQRVLEDKITGRTLSAKEKTKVGSEIEKLKNSLTASVKGLDLKALEKEQPEELARLYSKIYEEGKATIRLKAQTSVSRHPEELKKQEEIQKYWEDILEIEADEVKKVMNDWITKWYWQARAELVGSEPEKYPLLTDCIVPVWDEGKKIIKPTEEQIKKLKRVHPFKKKDKNGEMKETSVDLTGDLEIKFNGCYGFLTEEDKKDSSEGKEVFGLTKSPGLGILYRAGVEFDDETLEPKSHNVPSEFYLFKYCPNNRRDLEIGFEKKMFFNRLGYEEWLTKFDDKGSRNFFDICFEEVVETFAHELAHAIVNSIEKDYRGEEGGGHGEFFYEILAKIEKMIKTSPDFPDFETWWKKSEKEQQQYARSSILVSKESHWDKWKHWYIGGGIGVLIGGGFLVIFFWGEGRSNSKKNAKN